MKKSISILLIIVILTFGGCERSSDLFLSYQDASLLSVTASGVFLTETEFFAEDLAVIPLSKSSTGDQTFASQAAFLVNNTANEALYYKDIYEKLYPASITKLFTALVALKKGALTDLVTISHNAANIPEPGAKICGFDEGDVISLDALLNCMLIYSGNDAAIAIADHLGGSEDQFVTLMNEEAKRIGAVHSNFVNSHGLHDENHYTTAYDIYLAFHELIEYDLFRSIINTSSYTAKYADKNGTPKEKTFKTTNNYLSGETNMPDNVQVIGGKSGTTYKAGDCLILLSKDDKGNEYISVILKASGKEQLYNEMDRLLSMIE